MQGAGLAAVEPLAEIVCVPEIEIADLGALDADDPEHVTGRHLEGLGIARRNRELRDLGHARPDAVVEGRIEARELLEFVDDDGLDGAPCGGVRWCRACCLVLP